jgi:hypothetical protein
VSFTLAVLVCWVLDLCSWSSARRGVATLTSFTLFVAAGTACGLLGAVAVCVPVRVAAGAPTRRTRAALVGGLSLLGFGVMRYAMGATLVSRAESTHWAIVAAMAFVSLVLGIVLGLGLVSLGSGLRSDGSGRRSWIPIVVLGGIGAISFAIDQMVLVALYARAHAFVEALGVLSFALCIASLLACAVRRARSLRIALLVFSAAAFVWLGAFGASRPLRRALERSLPAVWEEPVYTARWLRRIQRLEDNVFRGGGEAASGLQRLAEKYELQGAVVDQAWHAKSVDVRTARSPERSADPPWNVVVFFVDTLRADVSEDAAVMPETLAWMNANTWFSRAYATGSSTHLTLAPMLGCRYDTTTSDRSTLLEAARANGMRTGLFIPRSASDYHRDFFPSFRFAYRDVVPDVTTRRASTSRELVDRSLAWVREERGRPFFLWLYDHDVHDWADLDDAHLEQQAAEAHLSKSGGLPWRYRAAARGVDRSFTRLRAGIEELGLADRTVILFVADHGEGLGQQDFWNHTTYLWESLLRVPLALHVPGVGPRRADHPVSTVDVATTLSRFVGPLASARTCHGEDLLVTTPSERRFPILFSAVSDGQIARVGILGRSDRKLVVDVRDASARLLRIQDGSSVEDDVSAAEPAELTSRLDELVRSPIYPR